MKVRYVHCPVVCEVDMDDAAFEEQLKCRTEVTAATLRNMRRCWLDGREIGKTGYSVQEIPDAEQV